MFILFEKANSRGDDSINNWDAMGWCADEATAMEWVSQNPEYRKYKYCTDSEYKH